MAGDKNQIWVFSEAFSHESEVLDAAREASIELGCQPVSTGTGPLLRVVASLRDAKSVVEIGTDGGVAGLWMLAGMNPRGTLTTIDPEAAYQQAAAQAFRSAKIPPQRVRFINGRPLDVLPRLAAGAYDMVTVQGSPQNIPGFVDHATRILKPGGALVLLNALWFGNVADPARRDPHTVIMREVTRDLLESEHYRVSLLPTGEGVLLAARR